MSSQIGLLCTINCFLLIRKEGINKDVYQYLNNKGTLPSNKGTAAGHHNVLLTVDVLLLKCVDNVLLLEAL